MANQKQNKQQQQQQGPSEEQAQFGDGRPHHTDEEIGRTPRGGRDSAQYGRSEEPEEEELEEAF